MAPPGDAKRLVFEALQPIFSELLLVAADEARMLRLLSQAHALLSRDLIVRAHLGQCLDYFLFPLHFMLDSVAALRSPPKQASPPLAVPAMRSGPAAERALECLELGLTLAALESEEQLVGLLKRFASLANMAPERAGEELVLRVLAALRACAASTAREAPHLFRALTVGDQANTVMLGYLLHGLLATSQRETERGTAGEGFRGRG